MWTWCGPVQELWEAGASRGTREKPEDLAAECVQTEYWWPCNAASLNAASKDKAVSLGQRPPCLPNAKSLP